MLALLSLLTLTPLLFGGALATDLARAPIPARWYTPDSGLVIVSLDSAPDKPLREILVAEIKRARTLGRTPFLELGATWCAPCQALQTVLDTKPTDSLVLREFAGTYLIRLDVDQWHQDFESVGIPASGSIPAFIAIDTTGQATDTFSGDSVRAMTPEGLRPAEAFFQAHLWKHGSAAQPRRTKR
jgi:hypothetical protein